MKMKIMIIRVIAVVLFFTAFAFADEIVSEFSFKTIDGKTIDYKAANRTPMVVNIAAYW